MLKSIIFIVIAVALSVFAEKQFLAQLERAAATRARRDENNPGRMLEFGVKDRAIVAVAIAAVMIILGLISKFWIVSTILALAISAILVMSNTFLKSNGINALTAFFLIWVGILISSIKDAGFTTATTGWGKVYIVIQVIMLVLLIVGSVAGNVLKFYHKVREENEDADKLEEKVKATHDDTDNEEDDEESDEEDGFDDEDPFNEEFWNKAIRIGALILIIALAFTLGFWLEMKFDFFPPYVS